MRKHYVKCVYYRTGILYMHCNGKATGQSPVNIFQIKNKFRTLSSPNYEMPGRTFFPSIPDMTVKIWKWKKRKMCFPVCTIRLNNEKIMNFVNRYILKYHT